MVMVATGNTISMAGTAVNGTANRSIQVELGGSGSSTITLNDTNPRRLVNKTTAGSQISLSDFYGKAYYIITPGGFSIITAEYRGYASTGVGIGSINNTLSTIYPGKTIGSIMNIFSSGIHIEFIFSIVEPVTNSGWSNITVSNSTSSFTLSRTAASFSNNSSTAFGNTAWEWSGANNFIIGVVGTAGSSNTFVTFA